MDLARLVKASSESIPKIAKELGVSDHTLRNWVRQADVGAGKAEGMTTDERARPRELEPENRTSPCSSGSRRSTTVDGSTRSSTL